MLKCKTCPAWAEEGSAVAGEGACRFREAKLGLRSTGHPWPITQASEWCIKHPDNTNLMPAAPKLVAALQGMLEYFATYEKRMFDGEISEFIEAREAIAAATPADGLPVEEE